MCFSAAASFTLSGVLAALGLVSLALSASKPRRMFAGIPLLFAVQQAAEGVVWLTLHGNERTLNQLASRVFLVVALGVWPIWSPLALRLAERDAGRRRALTVLLCCGGLVAVLALAQSVASPLSARVVGHSIAYQYGRSIGFPSRLLYLGAYVVPTVVPFFVSTLRMARALGLVLALSLSVSALVQEQALTSVWCFFAAFLSGLIVIAVQREKGVPEPPHAVPPG